jgi:hypothetical protein
MRATLNKTPAYSSGHQRPRLAVANLRRRLLVVPTDCFVAGFDPSTTSPYIDYATPLPAYAPEHHPVIRLRPAACPAAALALSRPAGMSQR